jgi:hypothetical protein
MDSSTRQQRRAAARAEAKRTRRERTGNSHNRERRAALKWSRKQRQRAVRCAWCLVEPARFHRFGRIAGDVFFGVLECEGCFDAAGLEVQHYGELYDGHARAQTLSVDGVPTRATDRVLVARSLAELEERVATALRESRATYGACWDPELSARVIRGELPRTGAINHVHFGQRHGLPALERIEPDEVPGHA